MCSRPQFTDLTYIGGTGPCVPMTIIFSSVIQSQFTSLNIKSGVNQTFHVANTPVYRFDLYGRYRTLWPIKIIFGYHIKSQYTILNTKFGVNQKSDVTKTPVYRFDLYGNYRTLQTDEDKCLLSNLELVYKHKYEIQYESDVFCAQDPREVPDSVDRYSPFSIPAYG